MYFEIVFSVFHLGLSQVLLHVVSVVGLVQPALLETVQHIKLSLAVGNWWNCLFESHGLLITQNKCCRCVIIPTNQVWKRILDRWRLRKVEETNGR